MPINLPNFEVTYYSKLKIFKGMPYDVQIHPKNSLSLSLFNFIPQVLFKSFWNPMVFWVMLSTIGSMLFPAYSIASPWVNATGFFLILALLLYFEASLNFKRVLRNQAINRSPVQVWDYKRNTFRSIPCEHLRVGHVVLLKKQFVPADILLLATSHPANFCHVETSAINGNFHLETKKCLPEISSFLEGQHPSAAMQNFFYLDRAVVSYEMPNANLTNFEGTIKLVTVPKKFDLTIENLILRGSHIGNTRWTIGIVLFAGPDTKIMRSIKTIRRAESRFDTMLRKFLRMVVFLGLILMIISFTLEVTLSPMWRITDFRMLVTQFTLYQWVLPFQLPILIFILQKIQSQFAHWDVKFYEEHGGTVIHNPYKNADLGRVEHIFTDKTGTLTENELILKKCFINSKTYDLSDNYDFTFTSQVFKHYQNFTYCDPALLEDLHTAKCPLVQSFFEGLMLCHTVNTRRRGNGDFIYEASSSDEEALVIAAHCMGFSFEGNDKGTYITSQNDRKVRFTVLGVNQFTHERLRMSIILQNTETEETYLYCKGSHQAMIDRCKRSADFDQIQRVLHEFEIEGLRTLLITRKKLSPEELDEYLLKSNAASHSLYDSENLLETLADSIEFELDFLGIAATEDKVQAGVPEAIGLLKHAGIKIWMLTGDKLAASISTAYSAGLFPPSAKLHKFIDLDLIQAYKKIQKSLSKYIEPQQNPYQQDKRLNISMCDSRLDFSSNFSEDFEVNQRQKMKVLHLNRINIGIVIDQYTWTSIENDPLSLSLFLKLASLCQSVIMTGVSPTNKAKIVSIVQRKLSYHPITLAVGDGLNDIPMQHTADIGVQVHSKNIHVKSHVCDVSVGKFKDLTRLILIHGNWNDFRIWKMIYNTLYLGTLYSLMSFYFNCYTGWSGIMLYKINFTGFSGWFFLSVQLIILGVFDKDTEASAILKHPGRFRRNLIGKNTGKKLVMKYVFLTVIDSLLLFGSIVTLPLIGKEDGQVMGLEAYSLCCFITMMGISAVHLFSQFSVWTALTIKLTVSNLVLSTIFISCSLAFDADEVYHYLSYPACILNPWLAISLAAILRLTQWHISMHKLKETQVFASDYLYYSGDELPFNFRAHEYQLNLNNIVTSQDIKKSKERKRSTNLYSKSGITLGFKDPSMERRYRFYWIRKHLSTIKIILLGLAMVLMFRLLFLVSFLHANYRKSVLAAVQLALVIVLFFLTKLDLFAIHYARLIQFVAILGSVVKLGSEVLIHETGGSSLPFCLTILFTILSVKSLSLALVCGVLTVATLIHDNYLFLTSCMSVDNFRISIDYSILLLVIYALHVITGRRFEIKGRDEFVLLNKVNLEYRKSQDILRNLLPPFVRDRVEKGVRYIAEEKSEVTILFCDIYNFDAICATLEPEELLVLLDKFFSSLDRLCNKFGLAKIETVNKTYLACAGLEDIESTLGPELQSIPHAERCVDMAIQVIQSLENARLKNGDKFQVKIGINSGPVTAGVVGKHKPQFSLVGDTVNTASRMCSTLPHPGKIQISEATQSKLTNSKYVLTQHRILAKGKGRMTTYYVEVMKLPTSKTTCTNAGSSFSMRNSAEFTSESLPILNTYKLTRGKKAKKRKEEVGNHYNMNEDNHNFVLAGSVQFVECLCTEIPQNHHFRVFFIQKYETFIRYGQWTLVIVYGLSTLDISPLFREIDRNWYTLLGLRVVCLANLGGLALFYKKYYRSSLFSWFVFGIYSLLIDASIVTLILADGELILLVLLEVIVNILIAFYYSGLTFGYILSLSVQTICIWLILLRQRPTIHPLLLECTLVLLIFVALNAFGTYTIEKKERDVFNLQLKKNREIQMTDELLSHMMPTHVLNALKVGITQPEKHFDVTILYADISGFTSWASDKHPGEVISMLSKLFGNFDKLCVKHQVYKVHTIGDCYVVLGLVNSASRNPLQECLNVVEMGLHMLQSINAVNLKNNTEFAMRIGIHTGAIVAGVSGTSIVRYDIYGSDNDIANLMESGGSPGKINVSSATMDLLLTQSEKKYAFQPNNPIIYNPLSLLIDSYFLTPIS